MISLPLCNEPWKASLPKIHRKRQHKARIRLVKETLNIFIGAASQSLLLVLGTRSQCQTSINSIHTGSANLLGNVGVLVGSFWPPFAVTLWQWDNCGVHCQPQGCLSVSRKISIRDDEWWLMMMICESNYHSWPSLIQFQSIIVHHPFPPPSLTNIKDHTKQNQKSSISQDLEGIIKNTWQLSPSWIPGIIGTSLSSLFCERKISVSSSARDKTNSSARLMPTCRWAL